MSLRDLCCHFEWNCLPLLSLLFESLPVNSSSWSQGSERRSPRYNSCCSRILFYSILIFFFYYFYDRNFLMPFSSSSLLPDLSFWSVVSNLTVFFSPSTPMFFSLPLPVSWKQSCVWIKRISLFLSFLFSLLSHDSLAYIPFLFPNGLLRRSISRTTTTIEFSVTSLGTKRKV